MAEIKSIYQHGTSLLIATVIQCRKCCLLLQIGNNDYLSQCNSSIFLLNFDRKYIMECSWKFTNLSVFSRLHRLRILLSRTLCFSRPVGHINWDFCAVDLPAIFLSLMVGKMGLGHTQGNSPIYLLPNGRINWDFCAVDLPTIFLSLTVGKMGLGHTIN